MKIELLDLTVRKLVEDYKGRRRRRRDGVRRQTGHTSAVSAGVYLQRKGTQRRHRLHLERVPAERDVLGGSGRRRVRDH